MICRFPGMVTEGQAITHALRIDLALQSISAQGSQVRVILCKFLKPKPKNNAGNFADNFHWTSHNGKCMDCMQSNCLSRFVRRENQH